MGSPRPRRPACGPSLAAILPRLSLSPLGGPCIQSRSHPCRGPLAGHGQPGRIASKRRKRPRIKWVRKRSREEGLRGRSSDCGNRQLFFRKSFQEAGQPASPKKPANNSPKVIGQQGYAPTRKKRRSEQKTQIVWRLCRRSGANFTPMIGRAAESWRLPHVLQREGSSSTTKKKKKKRFESSQQMVGKYRIRFF